MAEVAAIMRVSKMTVYRLVHNGELPAVRVGRSFRVPEQAVNDYLRKSPSSKPAELVPFRSASSNLPSRRPGRDCARVTSGGRGSAAPRSRAQLAPPVASVPLGP